MPTTIANPGDSIAQVRFKEPYVSTGLNKKLFGLVGAGVVRGGKLQTAGAGLNITIVADSVEGDSIYSYQDLNDLQFTVRQDGNVNLNLAAVAGTTVYVCLYLSYVIGATTVVEWRTYTEAELFTVPVAEAPFVVILGKVVVPGVGPILASAITPAKRRLAWDDKAPPSWMQVVQNTGFEHGFTASITGFFGIEHWLGSSFGTPNYRISTTAPYEGTREFQLEAPAPVATSLRVLYQQTLIRVTPGQFVRGRVRVRGTTFGPIDPLGHQGIALSWLDNDQVPVSVSWIEDNALSGTFAYTLIDGIVEVPAGVAFMRVAVGIHNNGAVLPAGSIFFDEAMCWVETQHPLLDAQDENRIERSMASEMWGLVPQFFDAATSMDDFVKRTWQLIKSAQTGAPVLDTILAGLKGGAAWRLFMSKGQIRSDGWASGDFDIPRFISQWISSGAVAANWTVLWEIGNATSTVNKVRIYARHGQVAGPFEAGDFALVINARWDGALWNKDDTTRKAFLLRLNAQEDVTGTLGGLSFWHQDEVTNSWADSAWKQTMNFGSAGYQLEDAAITFTVPAGFAGQILTALSGNVATQPDFHVSQRISDGAMIISHNADWDPVALLWNYDIGATTEAIRAVFLEGKLSIERFTGAGPTWAEGAWLLAYDFNWDATAGDYLFFDADAASATLDPGGPNRLFADNIAKMWAVVESDGVGGIVITDAFNVQSVVLLGGGVARITFYDAFTTGATMPYAGAALTAAGGPVPEFISYNHGTPSRVDVTVYDAAGAAVDLSTTARTVCIIGFGHQT